MFQEAPKLVSYPDFVLLLRTLRQDTDLTEHAFAQVADIMGQWWERVGGAN